LTRASVAGERKLAHTPTRGEKHERKRGKEKQDKEKKKKKRGWNLAILGPVVYIKFRLYFVSLSNLFFFLSLFLFILLFFFRLLVLLPHLLNNINKNKIIIDLKYHINIIEQL
jgi:hypothetical protein